MKIRPLTPHACNQRRAATRTAGRVEQIRIETAAFAVALRGGAIESKEIRRDMTAISMAHDKAPVGRINRWDVRAGTAAGAAWRGR